VIVKIFILLSLYISLDAHQTGLSYVNIIEDTNHNIEVVYKKPLSDKKGKDIKIRYPSHCIKSDIQHQDIVNGFIINKYKLVCSNKGLVDFRIWVDGLVSSDRGVLIRYKNSNYTLKSLLRATTPFIYINKDTSSFNLFLEYVKLGISHIWSGYDHLLFVLSLLLLSKNLKMVLYAISAFTLSHSITLACGILGIVNVGVAYIEAMIALSIVFLARELLIPTDTFTKKHLSYVAFIFGLLHGFGFSSSLRSIGLPQDEIPLSLFSFNLGIELGQIVFILCVSLLLALAKYFMSNFEYDLKKPLAYMVGTIASFWLIERVLGF
jgi:hydrogenase/urease accessory protein HupE